MLKLIPLLIFLASNSLATEEAQKDQPGDQDRANQRFYLQQLAYPRYLPNLQRLDLSYEPNPNLVYVNPGQQQGSPSTGSNDFRKGPSAKIENLDSDVELVPGAQTQSQNPNTQVPLIPQGGYSGLLPGQRFYIINPQQQLFNQNPLYTQLPNNFARGGPQIPDYQRFFLSPQAGVAGSPVVQPNIQGPGGLQNGLFYDPSVQSLVPSQAFLQQQQLRNPDLNQSKPVQDTQDESRETSSLDAARGPGLTQFQYPQQPQFLLQQQPQLNPRLYQAANLGLLSPGSPLQPQLLSGAYDNRLQAGAASLGPQYFPQQGQAPQTDSNGSQISQERANQVQLGGGSPYAPVFAGAPPAALPFFGVGRQLEIPLGQQQQYQIQPSPYGQLVQLGNGNSLPFPLLGRLDEQLKSQLGINPPHRSEDISFAASNKNDTNSSTESNHIFPEDDDSSKKNERADKGNESTTSSSQEATSTEKKQ